MFCLRGLEKIFEVRNEKRKIWNFNMQTKTLKLRDYEGAGFYGCWFTIVRSFFPTRKCLYSLFDEFCQKQTNENPNTTNILLQNFHAEFQDSYGGKAKKEMKFAFSYHKKERKKKEEEL